VQQNLLTGSSSRHDLLCLVRENGNRVLSEIVGHYERRSSVSRTSTSDVGIGLPEPTVVGYVFREVRIQDSCDQELDEGKLGEDIH